MISISSRIVLPLSSTISSRVLPAPLSLARSLGNRYKSKTSKVSIPINNKLNNKALLQSSNKNNTPTTTTTNTNNSIITTIGNKRPRDAIQTNTTSIPNELETNSNLASPVPAVYSEVPMAVDIRRQLIEAQIIPPKYEESVGQKARRWSFFILGGVVASIILGLYALSRSNSTAEELKIMEEIVQYLRKERKKAKQLLLSCVDNTGEITLNKELHLRWWATGPQNADIYIILVGTDDNGENAGIWGQVYHQLVQSLHIHSITNTSSLPSNPSIRIVTFHHKPIEGHTLSKYRPISLGMQDIEKLITSIHKPSSKSSVPKILLVEQGEGTWRSLAYTGLHVPNTLGMVSISPVYFHRGKRLAWYDALPQLSRIIGLQNYATNKELIQAYLDPPVVNLTPEMEQLLDKQTPRRLETIKFFSNIGFRNIDVTLAKRFAEDIRSNRAKESVLSNTENTILSGCGKNIAIIEDTKTVTKKPIVRAITYGEDILPSFLPHYIRNHIEYYFLLAANTIGTFMISDKDRESIQKERKYILEQLKLQALGTSNTNKDEENESSSFGLSMPSLESMLPQTYEGIQLKYAFRMLPVWLGLSSVSSIKPEKSIGYQSLENELQSIFPSNFQVTLFHNPPNETKYKTGVVSFPLQCSSAIAEEIIDVLTLSLQSNSVIHNKNNQYRHRII